MDENKEVVENEVEVETLEELVEPIKEELVSDDKLFAKVITDNVPIKSVITIRPGKTVAMLSFGDIVSVIKDNSVSEGWAKVEFNGLIGFIQKRYISEQK